MFKRYQMDFLISELKSLEGPSILKEAGIIKNESVEYNANRIIGKLINSRDNQTLFTICDTIYQRYERIHDESKKSYIPDRDDFVTLIRDSVAAVSSQAG